MQRSSTGARPTCSSKASSKRRSTAGTGPRAADRVVKLDQQIEQPRVGLLGRAHLAHQLGGVAGVRHRADIGRQRRPQPDRLGAAQGPQIAGAPRGQLGPGQGERAEPTAEAPPR
jgi:hypothetical protein